MPKGRSKEKGSGLFWDRADRFVEKLPLDTVFHMIREGAELNRTGQIGSCVLRAQALAYVKEAGIIGKALVMVMLELEQSCHKRLAGMWLKDHPEWMGVHADSPQC